MDRNDELERLRSEIRDVTADIINQVKKRMELARQIGEIKTRLNIDVKDEKVEQEIRSMVLKLSDRIGMNPEFAGRLLNILLVESVNVQKQAGQKQTHLGIFMKAKELEAAGKKIIHMEVGEPDYAPPTAVKNALGESYNAKWYHYTETRGIVQLRTAIANKVGSREENVIVTAGGRFAVFAAIVSLLKPGEELISIEPAWPAYKECADFAGAKTKVLRTTLEQKWTPDADQLEDMIDDSTKMIVLNYPNNPTGKVLDKKTMDAIVSLAKENDLYVLSDEVYSDYAFAGFNSILDHNYGKCIMVSSFSKSYAMTGFRVGYAVASKDIVAKMTKVQATALTSVAEPMQYSALSALNADPSENVKLMKRRLDAVCSRLRKMTLEFTEPEGAMYVYPRLPNGIGDLALVEKLLEMGVAVAPGSGFGDSYRDFIRISACQPEETLEKGLDVLESAIVQERENA